MSYGNMVCFDARKLVLGFEVRNLSKVILEMNEYILDELCTSYFGLPSSTVASV